MVTRNLAALALGALIGGAALSAPPAQARVDIGIGLGYPAYVAPPPVVAPAPAYYPPAYYAAPVYAAPAPGYWWYDQWGHRHWRRR